MTPARYGEQEEIKNEVIYCGSLVQNEDLTCITEWLKAEAVSAYQQPAPEIMLDDAIIAWLVYPGKQYSCYSQTAYTCARRQIADTNARYRVGLQYEDDALRLMRNSQYCEWQLKSTGCPS